MNLNVINNDANKEEIECDLIITDPPFDMSGIKLAEILNKQKCDHLILITTMKQLLEFNNNSNWSISFDFVLDHVVPKKSKNIHQPHYTHSTCVYFTRNGARSLFDRKKKERSDTYDGAGFWPTIIKATRNRMQEFGYAKNTQSFVDIIGSFKVKKVGDLFAGSGTTARACFELGIACILVEKDKALCDKIKKEFSFYI